MRKRNKDKHYKIHKKEKRWTQDRIQKDLTKNKKTAEEEIKHKKTVTCGQAT